MAFARSASMSTFVRQSLCYLAAAVFVLGCLSTTTTALPLSDLMGDMTEAARGQRVRRDVTACARPTNLEQMFQNLNSGITNTQFLRPAINSQAITIPANAPASWISDPNVNRTCPSTVTNNLFSAPLTHRSLCPFYFDIMVLPEGYYPRMFNYAKCKCQDCVENSRFGCEPVVTDVVVLKPVGCSNGLQLYKEEHIPVHTACTCATKGIQVGSTTTTAAPSGGGQEDW